MNIYLFVRLFVRCGLKNYRTDLRAVFCKMARVVRSEFKDVEILNPISRSSSKPNQKLIGQYIESTRNHLVSLVTVVTIIIMVYRQQ